MKYVIYLVMYPYDRTYPRAYMKLEDAIRDEYEDKESAEHKSIVAVVGMNEQEISNEIIGLFRHR